MKTSVWNLFLTAFLQSSILCSPLTARSDGCPEIQFNNQPTDLNFSSYSNDGVDPSTLWWNEPDKVSKREIKVMSLEDRDRLEAKGRALWESLQSVLRDSTAPDTVVCGIDSRWNLVSQAEKTTLDAPSLVVLPPGTIPIPQEGQNPTFKDVSAFAPKTRMPVFLYRNLYSPLYGVIAVANVVGRGWLPHEPRAPDRWSDVTWELWQTICVSEGQPPGGLNHIVQQGILHGLAKDILDHLITAKGRPNDFERLSTTGAATMFSPEHKAFYALLASPAVVGTVYMLMQHSQALGAKTIEKIIVSKPSTNGWHISIKLTASNVQRTPGGRIEPPRMIEGVENLWSGMPAEVIETD